MSGVVSDPPRRDEVGPRSVRVGMISLGCAKNLVDSEVMLGHLRAAGAVFVDDPENAEVLIVNTCSFIHAAREESVQTILEAAELKKTGDLRRLVVAGCMVQRYPEELRESLPEVDAFVGLDELDRIVERTGLAPTDAEVRAAVGGGVGGASTYLYDDRAPRARATPDWTAYVKIAEGCDHTCAFCAIPGFRGAFRSRRLASVIREAEQLAGEGVREINLIAQDSSRYGHDLGLPDGLADLLQGLNEVEALRWIRVHYLYPNTVGPRLIDAMASLDRVVPYVDMPLQHAHASTLKRMRRGGSAASHLKLLERFRRAMPDAALRSTFIVGFPGETEAEFEALLEFVDEARFDHLGAFTYSHEESTHAGALADDVPHEVKTERLDRLMERQRRGLTERLPARLGETVEVLVEGAHADTEHLLVGRMATQAPDVDGQVLINDGPAVPPGTFAHVRLDETAGYDYVGCLVGRV